MPKNSKKRLPVQYRTSICLILLGFVDSFQALSGSRKFVSCTRPRTEIPFSFQQQVPNPREPLVLYSSNNDDTEIVRGPVASETRESSSDMIAESSSVRKVARVEQFARLPVWPVWMGVIIFFVSRILGKELAAKVEDACGGRVCPNFFPDSEETSPFLMLVHHRHSFAPWDPIRWFQNRFILPEGFPAHPHRGFTTLTYFLKGGFTHRDSLGIAQEYGVSGDNEDFPHSQWLFTGAGLLHEEMFNSSPQQELYQLWINVPSEQKLATGDVQLLGNNECPKITVDGKSETVVLAGTYHAGPEMSSTSTAPIMSPLTVLHVRIEAGQIWSYALPETFETVVVYVRQGGCSIADTEIPIHHTAYLEQKGSDLTILADTKTGVDLLLLAGKPLKEPVAAQGSMVMNDQREIQQAYIDYQLGYMGVPWDHKLTDDEWKDHVANNPCRYAYRESSVTTPMTNANDLPKS